MSLNENNIVKQLGERNTKIRRKALKSLSAVGSFDDCIKHAIIDIFNEDRRGINRLEALNTLIKRWPDPDIVQVFRAALVAELFLAERAVVLLSEAGDAKAFDVLEEAFGKASNVWVRIRVLGVFHSAPQERILLFVKRSGVLACSEDNIRATAISMLSRVNNPTLARVFVSAISDRNDRVRANAIEGLGQCIGGIELARCLLPLAVDRNNRVRANALVFLLRLGVKKVERCLLKMAEHANALYRASAAYVLGEIPFGDSRKELLNRLLRDTDSGVVEQAERALQKQLAVA